MCGIAGVSTWEKPPTNGRASPRIIVPQRPGLDWDARVAIMPGVAIRVHDTYVAGEGILQASLFGLFSLVDLRGTGELAEGELMRFFAEAAWYPTALLPSQGVRWQAVDDHSAHGRLTDGHLSVTMLFIFSGNAVLESVRAERRGRTFAL